MIIHDSLKQALEAEGLVIVPKAEIERLRTQFLGNTPMSDLAQRLRDKANDIYSSSGETMKRWDAIRHQVETSKGSDLPRMNFEGLIEELADLLVEAAEAMEAT